MVLKASIILVSISITLLLIYGADIVVADGNEEGFLPFDHMTRGLGLGLPAIILPMIAFGISIRHKSKVLGGLLLVNATLIIAGGLFMIIGAGNNALESEPESLEEMVEGSTMIITSGIDAIINAIPLFIFGMIILVLGIVKIVKS